MSSVEFKSADAGTESASAEPPVDADSSAAAVAGSLSLPLSDNHLLSSLFSLAQSANETSPQPSPKRRRDTDTQSPINAIKSLSLAQALNRSASNNSPANAAAAAAAAAAASDSLSSPSKPGTFVFRFPLLRSQFRRQIDKAQQNIHNKSLSNELKLNPHTQEQARPSPIDTQQTHTQTLTQSPHSMADQPVSDWIKFSSPTSQMKSNQLQLKPLGASSRAALSSQFDANLSVKPNASNPNQIDSDFPTSNETKILPAPENSNRHSLTIPIDRAVSMPEMRDQKMFIRSSTADDVSTPLAQISSSSTDDSESPFVLKRSRSVMAESDGVFNARKKNAGSTKNRFSTLAVHDELNSIQKQKHSRNIGSAHRLPHETESTKFWFFQRFFDRQLRIADSGIKTFLLCSVILFILFGDDIRISFAPKSLDPLFFSLYAIILFFRFALFLLQIFFQFDYYSYSNPMIYSDVLSLISLIPLLAMNSTALDDNPLGTRNSLNSRLGRAVTQFLGAGFLARFLLLLNAQKFGFASKSNSVVDYHSAERSIAEEFSSAPPMSETDRMKKRISTLIALLFSYGIFCVLLLIALADRNSYGNSYFASNSLIDSSRSTEFYQNPFYSSFQSLVESVDHSDSLTSAEIDYFLDYWNGNSVNSPVSSNLLYFQYENQLFQSRSQSDYRDSELISLSFLSNSYSATDPIVSCVFQYRNQIRSNSNYNLWLTATAILLALAISSLSNFAVFAILEPIERTVTAMNQLQRDPLKEIMTKASNERESERERDRDNRMLGSSLISPINFNENSDKHFIDPALDGPNQRVDESQPKSETEIVTSTIVKLARLLQLSFGDAGSEIISKNLDGDSFDPILPGRKVFGIFGFCSLQDFEFATEMLNERVLPFVNQIAEIVHAVCHRHGGQVNRSLGGSFLLVWKLKEIMEAVEGKESTGEEGKLAMKEKYLDGIATPTSQLASGRTSIFQSWKNRGNKRKSALNGNGSGFVDISEMIKQKELKAREQKLKATASAAVGSHRSSGVEMNLMRRWSRKPSMEFAAADSDDKNDTQSGVATPSIIIDSFHHRDSSDAQFIIQPTAKANSGMEHNRRQTMPMMLSGSNSPNFFAAAGIRTAANNHSTTDESKVSLPVADSPVLDVSDSLISTRPGLLVHVSPKNFVPATHRGSLQNLKRQSLIVKQFRIAASAEHSPRDQSPERPIIVQKPVATEESHPQSRASSADESREDSHNELPVRQPSSSIDTLQQGGSELEIPASSRQSSGTPAKNQPMSKATKAVARLADQSLLAFLHAMVSIAASTSLDVWRKHKKLLDAKPEWKVGLCFGLHVGYAVQGAVGSICKIDATYLSPHVNISARLMAACKQYRLNLLISQSFYNLLHPAIRSRCRHVDRIIMKGVEKPMDVWTFDVAAKESTRKGNSNAVKQRIIRTAGDHADSIFDGANGPLSEVLTEFNLFVQERKRSSVGGDDSIVLNPRIFIALAQLQSGIHPQFIPTYNRGVEQYLEGNWPTARDLLLQANEMMPVDNSAQTLMEFMQANNFRAPDDWAGHRVLVKK